uniref:CSON010896 protein n=1 Tax=Culicoides sonorensis TaxID=179676 RepID=A0A336M2S4_CULSO
MEQYSNSCRICLCYISDNKSPGHDAMKSNPNLIKVYFEKCTKIKILEDEPQNCCLFCFTELRDFCKFLEKCDKTQKLLDDVRKSESYSQYMEPEIDDEFNLKQEIEWTGEGLSEILETEVSNHDAFNGDQCWMKSKTKKSQKICANEGGTESKQLKVICPYCGSLVKSTYLENHIKFVHMEPKNSYICDICKTQLSSKKSIIRHMTHVHLRTQKFKCKLCDVQFPTESLRKAHLIQIHNVQPPKACPYCQYRAFTKAHITRHIQRHRGDRSALPVLAGPLDLLHETHSSDVILCGSKNWRVFNSDPPQLADSIMKPFAHLNINSARRMHQFTVMSSVISSFNSAGIVRVFETIAEFGLRKLDGVSTTIPVSEEEYNPSAALRPPRLSSSYNGLHKSSTFALKIRILWLCLS